MSRVVLLLVLTLSACSLAGPGQSASATLRDADGVLSNRTSASLLALAVDAETATRIDIAPTFAITDANRNDVIASGDNGPLDVEAYDPGDDVVVFVYRVENDVAQFADTIQTDGATFERDGGVVTVRSL